MRHPLPFPAALVRGPARQHRWLPPDARLGAAAVVAVLAAASLPVAAASASGPAGLSAVPVAAVREAAVATVPLITGGQVAVTTVDGQHSFLLRGTAGMGAAFWYQDAAGDRFIVPAVAVPYVGRELGQSLFDVSALARDGITGRAPIPVSLRFARGATVAAPPGVKLTWARGAMARGYVTASSARRLAAALAGQDAADTSGGGHLARAGRLFGGLTSMTLAAPGAPAAPRPRSSLHTLRLKVTGLAGRPASKVLLVLMNTDNIHRELATVPVVNGKARVAVPAGDYSAIGEFLDLTAAGKPAALRAVIRDDFRVPASSASTTVTIAERAATSAVSVSVPRPAKAQQMETMFYRVSVAGGGAEAGLLDVPPLVPVYVSPQPAPKVGRLHYLERWSGGERRRGYWYDTAFAARDIPADEHFVARTSQLATVHEHFSADRAARSRSGSWSDDPYDPTLAPPGARSPSVPLVGVSSPIVTAMPGNLTVYIGTASGDPWVQTDMTPNFTYLIADPVTFEAGHSYSVDWAHGPLAPGLGQHTGPWQCQACTAGRTLSLNFSAAGDSEPGHFVPFLQDITTPGRVHFTLYRDGTRLLSSSGATGAAVRNIPASPGSYRAVLAVNLAGQKGFSQSTRTHTDLTVRYVPGGGAVLPASDTCLGQSAPSPCRVLAALTLGYHLATSQDNTSNAPTQVLHLRVGHVSYGSAGSHAPVTSAAVSVSFDGGKSWQRATVTGSGGSYTASWPNPVSARGTSPQLKVTAADSIGGSITQTITGAYTITKPSHASSPR